MARELILVVDDEAEILDLLGYNLTRNGYRVSRAVTGEDALRAAHGELPDLILLDVLLPGLDGLDVCRQVKADPHTARIPIIMLTAKSEETDIVVGLEVGADDYITKPFSPSVVIARVRAMLRRKAAETGAEKWDTQVGQLSIDVRGHRVRVGDRRVDLTLTQFRLLQLLASRMGWVFSRSQIVDEIQGPDVIVTDRSVDVHIVALRRKLGDFGSRIETVRGVGYRLRED